MEEPETHHYYRPQTKFAKVMFLHMSVCLQGGSTWASTPRQVHPPGRYTPGQVHPLLQAGTPPKQVHPQAGKPPLGRYTLLGRYTSQAGTPPWQVHPPGRYTPSQAGTPPRSSACWEIRTTSGRYASYWNAFLFLFKVIHRNIGTFNQMLIFRDRVARPHSNRATGLTDTYHVSTSCGKSRSDRY